MRTKIFLVAALVALGFAACNNEDVPYFSGEEGAPATLTVTLFTAPTTRSADESGNVGNLGGVTGTTYENAIHRLQVFLFDQNGVLVTSKFFSTTSTTEGTGLFRTIDGTYIANNIVTTTESRTMIVIANHPQITGYPTRSFLLDKVADVELRQNISTTGLVMTSNVQPISLVEGKNFWGIRPGGDLTPDRHHSRTANLLLHRINARVALTSVRFNNTTEDDRFDRFELLEVAMFNVRDGSRLFVNSEGTLVREDADFLFGANFPSLQQSYQNYGGTSTPGLWIDWTDEPLRRSNPTDDGRIPGFTNTRAMFFYVFENDGATLIDIECEETSEVVGQKRTNNKGTFIVLRGKLFLGASTVPFIHPSYTCLAGFTYYAIWVNCSVLGTVDGDIGDNSIRRNRQYNIAVNLWGPGNNNLDPTKANLDVHVQVAPWIQVGQNVDWGQRPNGNDPEPGNGEECDECHECGEDPCECCDVCEEPPCTCEPD